MKTILIAENNKRDLRWYPDTLSKHDYHVLIAADAAESLKSYRSELEKNVAEAKRKEDSSPSFPEQPFDAVILNHRISNRDGLQVASEILSVNPRQRIIFVSDSDEYTEELQKAFYGRVDIMQKPFAPEALIDVLESAEVYKALEKLGLNVKELKGYHLYHFQLLELLAACLALLEAGRENGK